MPKVSWRAFVKSEVAAAKAAGGKIDRNALKARAKAAGFDTAIITMIIELIIALIQAWKNRGK